MHAPFDVTVARRLTAWTDALEELRVEAQRTADGDADPQADIALLHVLEQRAHEAFADYRDHVLHGCPG